MKGESKKFSFLLELAASNDLTAFKNAIEEECRDIDEASLWYGRRTGSRKMVLEERTPLSIASMFGSKDVVHYIIETGRVDVNKACGPSGATALHCAISGGSFDSIEVVRALLEAFADTNALDANGNRPIDLIVPTCDSSFGSRNKMLESMLKGNDNVGEIEGEGCNSMPRVSNGIEKKEYSIDPTLPNIKNEIFGTDEFRMYNFKVTPCSRAYSHDWTECPFVHPAENARRRDPRKYHYSCVPCPEYRKGSCKHGDKCEYAHGIFESWLHPAQYRTRLCKDETNCDRKVCFFAHRPEELRPLYASTGSALPSPTSTSTPTSTSSHMVGVTWPSQSNTIPTLHLHESRLKSARRARNMDLNMEQLGLEAHRRHQNQQLINEIPDLFELGFSSPTSSTIAMPSNFSGWGSPDGKLDWAMQGDELTKFRKSSSWTFNLGNALESMSTTTRVDPDISWVQSLVKDIPFEQFSVEDEKQKEQSHINTEESATFPAWVEQMYIEQDQMMT